MFIIALTYIKPVEEVEKYLQAHVAYLDKYYAKGTFLCSGRKVPRTGGFIFGFADNLAAMEAITHEDPFYINSIAHYEITEFTPTKYVKELAPFFE